MDKLKTLTAEGIGHALRKAERYRLLGEPCEAESICRDVLEVDPVWVGGLSTVLGVADALPKLFVARWIERRPRKMSRPAPTTRR
jgi:hypothetical protein